MAKIILKLLKDNKPQIQDAQRMPNLINKKHIQMYHSETDENQRQREYLKDSRSERKYPYRGTKIRTET